MPLEIVQIPVLNDNYVYLAREPQSGAVGVVDPAVHEPVLAELKRRNWTLTHILNTHHHPDHVGGNMALKEATGCRIIGPEADAERIPGLDIAVGDNEGINLGNETARVFDVPGHTKGHIAYWFADSQAVLRRYAVRAGLRPAVRGHAGTDVVEFEQAAPPARRDARLLCA